MEQLSPITSSIAKLTFSALISTLGSVCFNIWALQYSIKVVFRSDRSLIESLQYGKDRIFEATKERQAIRRPAASAVAT